MASGELATMAAETVGIGGTFPAHFTFICNHTLLASRFAKRRPTIHPIHGMPTTARRPVSSGSNIAVLAPRAPVILEAMVGADEARFRKFLEHAPIMYVI